VKTRNSEVDPDLAADLERIRDRGVEHVDQTTGTVWEYFDLGEGPPTLFLHGMAGGYDIWFRQLLAMSEHRRVVAVTYPPISTMEELTGQLMGLLDSLEIATTDVVGSSLGGHVAQYLVANYPDRIVRAVFANTFPPNSQIAREHAELFAAVKAMPSEDVMSRLRENADANIVPAAGGSPIVRAYLLGQAAGRMSKAQFVARYACVLDTFDPPDPSAKPLMLIEATNDPLVSPVLRELLTETYPKAQMASLGDVGHFPYLNEGPRYTALLEEFFS
jgi:pimeloyl-ACP methyl ester carboxylesterase